MGRLIFVLGALMLAGIVCAQPECNPEEVMACFRPFANLHFDVAHEMTATDMETMCEDWDKARPCLHSFIRGRCQDALPNELISTLRALEDVADYICTDALPEIMREHQCFFNSHSEAQICMEHLGIDATEAANPQALLKSLSEQGGCDRLSRYEVCVISKVTTICSPRASDVIRHVYMLINRELQNILGCRRPILSQPEPTMAPDDAPGEDMRCPAILECMKPFEGSENRPSDRCRMFMKLDRCLQRAMRECRNSHRIIERILQNLRETERREHCQRSETSEPIPENIEHRGNDSSERSEHHKHRKFTRAMKIGIPVGVAAIVIVLIIILVAVCQAKRRRSERLDKSQLVDKETYKSNLSIAVVETKKNEKE